MSPSDNGSNTAADRIELDNWEVWNRMENGHFVQNARPFTALLADPVRDDQIRYYNSPDQQHYEASPNLPVLVMSEWAAFLELDTFLTDTAATLRSAGVPPEHRAAADSAAVSLDTLHTELTIIGGYEEREATNGLARYWLHLLHSNPDSRLYVPALITQARGTIKSDTRVIEAIRTNMQHLLSHLTSEEQDAYLDRVVTEPGRLDPNWPPESVIPVITDNMVASGAQVRTAYARMLHDPRSAPFARQAEVHLLVAAQNRLADGIPINLRDRNDGSLPVRAYWRAIEAPNYRPTQPDNSLARITLSSASVDYSFENNLVAASDVLFAITGQRPPLPAMANIARP